MKNTIPKNIFFFKKIINLNWSYKKEKKFLERERERERERVLIIFVWKKYGLNEKNDIKFIQNKMERKIVKLWERENDEESVTVK